MSKIVASALDLPKSGTVTVAPVPSIGEEVVGKDELRTATGVFEILAGGVLGVAANVDAAFGIVCSLRRKQLGVTPSLWWVIWWLVPKFC